jgi:hypothetical protein
MLADVRGEASESSAPVWVLLSFMFERHFKCKNSGMAASLRDEGLSNSSDRNVD